MIAPVPVHCFSIIFFEKDDGLIITKQIEILKRIENYYTKLYENKNDTLKNVDLDEYMKVYILST